MAFPIPLGHFALHKIVKSLNIHNHGIPINIDLGRILILTIISHIDHSFRRINRAQRVRRLLRRDNLLYLFRTLGVYGLL
jgi:hypothetical protein